MKINESRYYLKLCLDTCTFTVHLIIPGPSNSPEKSESLGQPKARNNYGGHIRRGKEFLANFSKEEQDAEELDEEAQMDPLFHVAFTGPPIRCTPTALSMFLAHKCFTEDYGKSTASAIHAAFLDYFE